MIRQPPSSTLFPYTRSSDLTFAVPARPGGAGHALAQPLDPVARRGLEPFATSKSLIRRSEEHTSELQSRRDLVCRPLLEKKSRSPAHAAAAELPDPAYRPQP